MDGYMNITRDRESFVPFPSHTTARTGPYTAVQWILAVWFWCYLQSQEAGAALVLIVCPVDVPLRCAHP